ncbi:4Fe-4S binding protein [Leyella stercorea]|uniref:4Fe-4S binding protein n=1 Tax=Leyella stercorea TaxID=363265 RepID=UPI00242B3EC7|nr:4Fe-4S binding protein [Leyella stercorea]
MLRRLRVTLAAVFFTLITLLFLDYTGTLHTWLGWLAKIQFLPALLALNVGVVVALVLLTLVFGRIYCSVVCPLGVMQDVVSWISGRRKKRKFRFSHSPEKRILRYGVLALFIVAFIAGIGSLVALLAPYSSYGRIAQNIFQPVYILGNNLMAWVAERVDSYAFYSREVWMRSLSTFIIAAITLVGIGVLAWRNGRTYCNTICPVGTILSLMARFSWFKVKVDETKCNKCGLCSRSCKSACIDFKNSKIDYSRCVVCGDCIDKCRKKALSYTHSSPKKTEETDKANMIDQEVINSARRSFLLGAAIATTSAVIAQEKKKVDGGLAEIEDKQAPKRNTPLTPPGSLSAQNMARHCTACQLCVAECPNDVLRPSTDIMKLMQPTMSYERGYCRPECNRCSEVCPAGAIKPIKREDKSSIQIGHAVWIKKNCVPITDGKECGNCARHCSVGAITMINSNPKDDTSPKIPAVNTSRCIGCGACENLCPARPFSAIYVEGHEVHRYI